MKNFQVKMVNVTESYSLKIFFWKLYLIIRTFLSWQQDSVLFTGSEIYPPIYHGVPCPAVFISETVNQVSEKDRLFHLLWLPSALGENLTMRPPSSRIQFHQKENIPGHSIERRAYWFVFEIAKLPVPTDRAGIGWWTLFKELTCKR